jgi:hypothetical protein
VCLDNESTNDKYQEALRVEYREIPWLYAMEDYVCASDAGSWCIYAEKQNDVAVIALRNISASTQFHYALGYLGADSLTYLLRTSFPFTHLTLAWRDGYPKVMPLFEAKSGGFGVTARTLPASVAQGPDAGAHSCSRCANVQSLRGLR